MVRRTGFYFLCILRILSAFLAYFLSYFALFTKNIRQNIRHLKKSKIQARLYFVKIIPYIKRRKQETIYKYHSLSFQNRILELLRILGRRQSLRL